MATATGPSIGGRPWCAVRAAFATAVRQAGRSFDISTITPRPTWRFEPWAAALPGTKNDRSPTVLTPQRVLQDVGGHLPGVGLDRVGPEDSCRALTADPEHIVVIARHRDHVVRVRVEHELHHAVRHHGGGGCLGLGEASVCGALRGGLARIYGQTPSRRI